MRRFAGALRQPDPAGDGEQRDGDREREHEVQVMETREMVQRTRKR